MMLHEVLFPGSSEIDMLFKQFKLLGTPDELSWPGVTSLANWSDRFPRFRAGVWCEKIQSNPEMHNVISSLVCCCPPRRQSAGALLGHSAFRMLDPALPSQPKPLGSDRRFSGQAKRPEVSPTAERLPELHRAEPHHEALQDQLFSRLARESSCPEALASSKKARQKASLLDEWHLNTQIRNVR